MGFVYKLGSTGPEVKALQDRLIQLHHLPATDAQGHANRDGKFGRLTQEAVRAFQTAKNLRPDGVVGAATAALLDLMPPAVAQPQQDGHVFNKAQLVQLAELVDACIPTGPLDLFDGPAILWAVEKIDGLLASALPPQVLKWVHDLSSGVDAFTLDNLERRLVPLLNQQINLPLLSESTEEKVIRMVVDTLVDALHLGRTFDDAVKSVRVRA